MCDCASENLNFMFYHMLMFNCSFLSQLVPEYNKIWYLGMTRTCLKRVKSFFCFTNMMTENYQLNKPLHKYSQNT